MGLVWSVTKQKSLRFPTHLVYEYDEQRLRSEFAFFFLDISTDLLCQL